jgi:hypothetical protein
MSADRTPSCFPRAGLAIAVFAASCGGGPVPSSIRVADRVTLTDLTLARVDAVALDEKQAPIEELDVVVTAVGDPSVVKLGNNGELQCQRFGTTTATVSAPPLQVDIVVECMLVREVAPSVPELELVLSRDDAGAPVPARGGPLTFTVVGLDGQPIPGVQATVTASSPDVFTLHPDGSVEALRRGRGSVKAVFSTRLGTTEVRVLEEVATRKAVPLADGATLSLPLGPGSYKVAAGGTEAIALRAEGGACPDQDAAVQVEAACTFDQAGALVIENPSTFGLGAASTVSVRVLQLP